MPLASNLFSLQITSHSVKSYQDRILPTQRLPCRRFSCTKKRMQSSVRYLPRQMCLPVLGALVGQIETRTAQNPSGDDPAM